MKDFLTKTSYMVRGIKKLFRILCLKALTEDKNVVFMYICITKIGKLHLKKKSVVMVIQRNLKFTIFYIMSKFTYVFRSLLKHSLTQHIWKYTR
jgi:hypothetical protein